MMILDILTEISKGLVENAGAIATLAGVLIAWCALRTWKHEYTFKRDSELLEEALLLFYQAEHAIAYLRNGLIFTNDLHDFQFPEELEEGYSKEKYKYTHTIRKRFDEKQEVFAKLYAMELRFRARFGNESITPFARMKEKVKELLLAAERYSLRGLKKEENADIQRTIWKPYRETSEGGDTFGEAVSKIVREFDSLCRKKMQ
jgi:hypothetical protein